MFGVVCAFPRGILRMAKPAYPRRPRKDSNLSSRAIVPLFQASGETLRPTPPRATPTWPLGADRWPRAVASLMRGAETLEPCQPRPWAPLLPDRARTRTRSAIPPTRRTHGISPPNVLPGQKMGERHHLPFRPGRLGLSFPGFFPRRRSHTTAKHPAHRRLRLRAGRQHTN